MSEEKNMEQTEVKQNVEVNLDEIFNGAPGADSITLPEETTKKPSLFSRPENVDLSFIDDKEEVETEEVVTKEVETTNTEPIVAKQAPNTILVSPLGSLSVTYFPSLATTCTDDPALLAKEAPLPGANSIL